MQQELDNTNFRMEKSVMSKKNMDELYQISKDRVPESVLQYICYTHQYNIFGFGFIEPEDFESRMKFTRGYLQDKVENSYQERIVPSKNKLTRENLRKRNLDKQQQNIAYENRFENSLFILANYPLYINATSVSDDKYLIRTIRPVRVLKEFSIIQDKKTGKIKYSYQLEEDFRRNLDTMYLNVNLDSIVKLRKSNLGPLYYFLLKLQNALIAQKKTRTEKDNTPQFNYLCELTEISQNLERKHQKSKLKEAFKKINTYTELDIILLWAKNENGEKYIPIIEFNLTEEQKQQMANERLDSIQRFSEKINVATTEFMYNLFHTCPYRNERNYKDAEKNFILWIKRDDDIFNSQLTTCLADTFINIACKIPKDIHERVMTFKRYAKDTNSIEDMKQWLGKLFSENFKLTPERIINSEAL